MTKTSYHREYGVCAEMANQADLCPEKSCSGDRGCAGLSQAGRRSSQCAVV